MNGTRIRTCTRDPRQRQLFVGIALVLRIVWAWLHFRHAKEKCGDDLKLFLELLRFNDQAEFYRRRKLGCYLFNTANSDLFPIATTQVSARFDLRQTVLVSVLRSYESDVHADRANGGFRHAKIVSPPICGS